MGWVNPGFTKSIRWLLDLKVSTKFVSALGLRALSKLEGRCKEATIKWEINAVNLAGC